MEAPASSSAPAAESLDAKLAENEIANDIVAAENVAHKRPETSEAAPMAVESSLQDAISASFYTPGQRLSLDDIAALLDFSDAAVLSVLKLRNEHNAGPDSPPSQRPGYGGCFG
eukprot:jgi/Mesvir1/6778/Mv18966-RA.1